LRASLQMTKLHHKLCFIKFIITSEVIVKVPLAKAALAKAALAEAVPTEPALTEARLQPVQVVDQWLHHLILHQLAARGLDCGRMPLPDSSTSAHT